MRLYKSKPEEKKSELKDVAITIRRKCVILVDPDTGRWICNLAYMDNSIGPCYSVARMLISKGYRTNFAEWDEKGCLVKLLEDVEE